LSLLPADLGRKIAAVKSLLGIFLSVVVAGDEGAALADEKIEVGPFARLQHVVEVQLPVAAIERRRRALSTFLFA